MGWLVGEDEAARRHKESADPLAKGDFKVWHLMGRFAPDLADRFLHGEHAIGTGVGVGETAAVGVEGQLPAWGRVPLLDKCTRFTPTHEAQVLQRVKGQVSEGIVIPHSQSTQNLLLEYPG